MSYAKTLSQMVNGSRLSLQQISNKCEHLGAPVVPSYISKLQNGKQAPPSDKVSDVLARACGADPEVLIYEGYIEKAPEFIQNILRSLADFGRHTVKTLTLASVPEELLSIIEAQIDTVPDLEIIKQFGNQAVLADISETAILKDHEDSDVKLIANPLLGLPMPDESMGVPVGTKCQFESVADAENGDVLVVELEDKSYVIRRYFNVDGTQVLIADAKGYEPILFDPVKMKIVGRVKSVTLEI